MSRRVSSSAAADLTESNGTLLQRRGLVALEVLSLPTKPATAAAARRDKERQLAALDAEIRHRDNAGTLMVRVPIYSSSDAASARLRL